MDLTEATRALLPRLPRVFQWDHVVRYTPRLFAQGHAAPDLPERMRRALDDLVRDESVQREGPRTWRRAALRATHEPEDHLDIAPGETITRATIARILDLKGAAPLRRGLFRRARGPYSHHLLLFHDEATHADHADRHPGHIRFTGQGLRRDQLLTHFNHELLDHLDRGLQVHYFVAPRDQKGKIRYEGEVAVCDVQRIEHPQGRRSRLEYDLVRARPHESATQYGAVFTRILENANRPRLDARVLHHTPFQRTLHERALRTIVRHAYGSTCAACGPTPRDPDGRPDIEAVALVAPAEQGPSAPQNALALCARHAWALRHGRLVVTDTKRLESIGPRTPEHGRRLHLPAERGWHPQPLYVRHHRRKWRRVARSVRDAPAPFTPKKRTRNKPRARCTPSPRPRRR